MAALQTPLSRSRFDPGPDGQFGWLTYDSLCGKFQRAMRLHVMAWPASRFLCLAQGTATACQPAVYIVASRRDAPTRILRRYGLRPEALYAYNSLRSLKYLYEGQEVILPQRLVIAYMADGDRSLGSLLWHHRFERGVAGLWLQIGERQELVGSIPEQVAEAARGSGICSLLPVLTNLGKRAAMKVVFFAGPLSAGPAAKLDWAVGQPASCRRPRIDPGFSRTWPLAMCPPYRKRLDGLKPCAGSSFALTLPASGSRSALAGMFGEGLLGPGRKGRRDHPAL